MTHSPDLQPEKIVEISLVVPVYKEESNIRPFLARVEVVLSSMAIDYEIIFALDPSPDKTEEAILAEIKRNSRIRLMVFSRRFGQPAATLAGIHASLGNFVVLIDVDLQDPPELIADMYRIARGGVDVVYARRTRRLGETGFKKLISVVGSYMINKLSDVDIPRNVGEFRIMSRRVVDQLTALKETHGFIRGLVAFVGFQQQGIEFERNERTLDAGKYNRFTGSFKIGLNGLIGFSSRPLQLMSISGFALAFFSFFIGIFLVLVKILGYPFAAGQTGIVLAISFFSGLQLLAMGLIGEYIGRIYDEVKHRPPYIVDKRINFRE